MAVARKSAGTEREHNKATVRVLDVLSRFASDISSYGVTELAQALGMTKNMTYRALTTLVEQGYLMRETDGTRYQLGWRILELQSPYLPEPDFRGLGMPYVRRVHDLTGESTTLLVRSGDYAVMIDGIETRKHGVWRVRIGELFSLWGPAAGRVMLAHDRNAAVADYLQHTQQDNEAVWSEIANIRERGYARVTRGEAPQMVSIAFPVFDIDGQLHGALAVGGPRHRFETQLDSQMDELAAIVGDLNQRSRLFPADAARSELH